MTDAKDSEHICVYLKQLERLISAIPNISITGNKYDVIYIKIPYIDMGSIHAFFDASKDSLEYLIILDEERMPHENNRAFFDVSEENLKKLGILNKKDELYEMDFNLPKMCWKNEATEKYFLLLTRLVYEGYKRGNQNEMNKK